jgi:hypothetical protein
VFSVLEIVTECQNNAAHAPTLADRAISLIPVLTPFIAVYTFWLGYRQKENERCFTFYNDVVINPAMDELNAFFERYVEKLSEEARKPSPDTARTAIPRSSTKLITEFSEDLYRLKDSIVKRLGVFDQKAAKQVVEIIDQFDTSITRWMVSRSSKDIEALEQHITKAKRSLIRCIYKGKHNILR